MGAYGSPELNRHTSPSYEQNMIFCSNCGARYSKKIGKCPQCGKKHAQPFYNKWWFWVLIVLVLFAFYPNPNNGNRIEKTPTYVPKNEQSTISKEDYKANCQTISYSDAARNPNNYIGKYVIFTGKIVQVQENGTNSMLRMNVTQDKYGIWKDTLYIDYQKKSSDESRILENDIITAYGKMNGIKSYESVLGNQVSIPHLIAEYIEIQ